MGSTVPTSTDSISRDLDISEEKLSLLTPTPQMERDGVVRRIVHHQVPPKVEYGLTDWGQALCPALDAILKWAASRDDLQGWTN